MRFRSRVGRLDFKAAAADQELDQELSVERKLDKELAAVQDEFVATALSTMGAAASVHDGPSASAPDRRWGPSYTR